MCIMAGCDFLKAIPGIGIRKAHAQMRKLKSFVRVGCSLSLSRPPVQVHRDETGLPCSLPWNEAIDLACLLVQGQGRSTLQCQSLSETKHLPNCAALNWRGGRQVCKSLRFSGLAVPQGYEQAFQHALWAFTHQTVYCPRSCACVPLHPVPPSGLEASAQVCMAPAGQNGAGGSAADSLLFLGRRLPDATACDVAKGEEPGPTAGWPVVMLPCLLPWESLRKQQTHGPVSAMTSGPEIQL